MTHSCVAFSVANEALRLLTTQPTSGGANSSIVSHDIAITFDRPSRAVVSSTTGPGSSNWYTRDNASDRFMVALPRMR